MNKNIVITGCNRGLGAGIRDEFLKKGDIVYGINKTLSQDLTTLHESYYETNFDVSNFDELKRKELKEFVPENIDVLILNAGIRRFETIKDMNIKDWIDSVNTNLNGVFNITNLLIENVIKSKGDIIIIGSHSEKYTFEMGSAYCSTKGSLKEFSECLMHEVRYDDVRVSYLSLGSIKNRDHGGDEEWKLKPSEVGKTICELVSLPKNVMIPYLDVRPAKPLRDEKSGIERLQYV